MAASFLFTSLACGVYRYSPHSADLRAVWHDYLHLAGTDVLTLGYLCYTGVLMLFYALESAPSEAKSVAALRAITAMLRRPGQVGMANLPARDRLGLLTMLLKGFFAPLMVLYLADAAGATLGNAVQVAERLLDGNAGLDRVLGAPAYWCLFQLALLIDLSFFTLGYLVEHPRLHNEIRSVDPTALGWMAALACYLPFNNITAQVLGGQVDAYPQFTDAGLHAVVNVSIIALMFVYASASVALNLRASNLTHRGIVAHGPYRYLRHPAYVCKNLAWWLGTLPAMIVAWQASWWTLLGVIAGAAAWSALYILRALTEEQHLLSVDDEYAAYCQRVPWRFIPGVI